jgi:hypothetical protein
MDMTTLPAVAKKIYFACKKCGCERYQVVISHTGPTTARLECEVCKSKTAFKLEEPKRTRSVVPKKKPSTKSRVASHVARFTELRDKNNDKPRPYNMKTEFEVGTVLEHPKFGLGFVILSSGAAIQVVFEDEERSLVHNRV